MTLHYQNVVYDPYSKTVKYVLNVGDTIKDESDSILLLVFW